MPIDSVLDGARWALVVVFLLSVAEKGQTLWRRSAAWHPVMLARPAWRSRAAALMAVALGAELATIALLALAPLVGAAAAAALVVGYTVVALPAQSAAGVSCRCFWKLLDSKTKASLIARNGLLLALAVMGALAVGTGAAGALWGVGIFTGLAAITTALDARFDSTDEPRTRPRIEVVRITPDRGGSFESADTLVASAASEGRPR